MQYLKNGVNALWPNQYSVIAYAKLAEKLLKNDTMISKLEMGSSKIASFFDWDKISFEYECALHE